MIRHQPLVYFFMIVLPVMTAVAAQGEVIEIDVQVKAVEAERRTISAERNKKTLDLNVTKTAEVTLNGHKIELAEIPIGCEATLKDSRKTIDSTASYTNFDSRKRTVCHRFTPISCAIPCTGRF